MDAIERGNPAALKIACHSFVGGQHEFFNEAVGDVPFRARNAHHAAELVELNQRLRQIEIDGSALHAPTIENEREFLHKVEIPVMGSIALRLLSAHQTKCRGRPCRSCVRRCG